MPEPLTQKEALNKLARGNRFTEKRSAMSISKAVASKKHRKAQMLAWEEKPISNYLPLFKYLTLTQLYKIVSGYGEKWQQALVSFIAVWLVFASINWVWIEPKTVARQQAAQTEKWYRNTVFRGTGSAVLTLQALTLQRWDRDFQIKGASSLGQSLSLPCNT